MRMILALEVASKVKNIALPFVAGSSDEMIISKMPEKSKKINAGKNSAWL
jgi:hypothetical protein